MGRIQVCTGLPMLYVDYLYRGNCFTLSRLLHIPQREPSDSLAIPAIDGNIEQQPAAPEKVNLSMGDEERESFSISNEYIEEQPKGRGSYVEHHLEEEPIDNDSSIIRANHYMENVLMERDFVKRSPSAPELRINRFMEDKSKRDNYIYRPPSAPYNIINKATSNQRDRNIYYLSYKQIIIGYSLNLRNFNSP